MHWRVPGYSVYNDTLIRGHYQDDGGGVEVVGREEGTGAWLEPLNYNPSPYTPRTPHPFLTFLICHLYVLYMC